MTKIKLALIDTIGTVYDGDTPNKHGLGGSESHGVFMSRELVKLGFDVTVYNNCIGNKDTSEGVYDGVRYVDLQRLHTPNDFECDIMVVTRSVLPYLPEKHWSSFNNYPASVFQKLKKSARRKILLLHDSFCAGDHLLEEMLVDGHIDELFTLSDWHTSYITNCQHGGPRRNFEVLKNKVFMTRNGATTYDVGVVEKDPSQFVYNAAVSKGMMPLVLVVWPEVKRRIPNAKLTVIGGFYRFRDGAAPDVQEASWRELVVREDLKNLDITFTGIIPQKEIAGILARSSFMIYPAAFPETFGISSLESLLYNTPIITNRFGALEETAIDAACYKLDYAIEPNNLFPAINKGEQVKKFVDLVVKAYSTPYLHYQKQHACRQVHDIASWDTVALQWKQQFYKTLGLFLPVDEYRAVTRINTAVQRVFGRRFINPVEAGWTAPSSRRTHIEVVSPVYNGALYIRDCILSVAQQDYPYYNHTIIDDCSTDDTYKVARDTIDSLPPEVSHKFTLVKNDSNMGSVYNYFTEISGVSITHNSDFIVMMLDGDDHLVNDPTIFNYYADLYAESEVEFTYGSMWSKADKIALYAQEYPRAVRENKSYRDHKFPWNMPYTHLRTFTADLFSRTITEEMLKDDEGNWLRAGGDTAFFYNLIEAADPEKIVAVPHIMYHYNDSSPHNDFKIHSDEQTKTANAIMSKKTQQIPTPQTKKRILIAIPTAKYIEVETFKSIWDLQVPVGYEVDFRYTYGYAVDQLRNLIASWTVDGKYDYLFGVDSDMVIPSDALVKLLSHDKDVVSGLYIQRNLTARVPEIFRWCGRGLVQVALPDLLPQGLHQIDACGFGCVLVKTEVFRTIGYPQFDYKMESPAHITYSEDTYFAMKAAEHGFKFFVDSTIVCGHIGSYNFTV